MQQNLVFVFAIVLGGMLVYLINPWDKGKKEISKKKSDGVYALQKREVKSKIMSAVKKGGRVTNNEVEDLLKVSDSTATRYLDELESEGRLRQVGETGRGTYYVIP